jgi:oligopeptide transport system substrate-binding protein
LVQYLLVFRLILALVLILSACGSPPRESPNTLRISFTIFPSTFDPRRSGDFISATLTSLIYEGLTRCLPDGSSEPALAERVDISSDGKVYTFHLRESFWSDGTPVKASDFEKTWKQILDPARPSLCAYLFYPIKNAEAACHHTKTLDEVGIRAIDDLTLEIELERQTPYFLSLTSFPSFLPIPQHRIDQMEPSLKPPEVVNGPFIVKSVASQASIILVKNPKYWNVDNLKLDGINISIIPGEMTSFAMFERGELDWLGGILSPIYPEALASEAAQSKAKYFPMSASTFFAFNTRKSPFSNEHIRKAFGYAVNRARISSEILPNNQVEATRCIPPALCNGKDRNILPEFDPILAKAHLELGLKELGMTLEDISPVVLHFRTGVVDRMIAQVVQGEWAEVLGVEVQLVQADFKTHKDTLHNRNFDVAISNWVAQYHDPINILERFKNSSNAKNYAAWDNQDFSMLIDFAAELSDDMGREQIIEQAEDIIAEKLPILPIYHWCNPSLCSSRLRNIHTTPSGGVLFERCWIENESDKKIR